MKKQICLHVFNDFKSFLVNEIELTIKHYDWSKRLFKVSLFVHLKKIKFQKISLYTKFFFFSKRKRKRKKDSFQKKLYFQFFFSFQTTSEPDYLWERYIGNLFKGLVPIIQKKKIFISKLQKKKFTKLFFFGTTFRPDSLWERYVGSLFKGLVTIT